MNPSENTDSLSRFIREKTGIEIFGVAQTDEIKSTIADEILEVSRKLGSAIVIGYPLSNAVLETINDKPNVIYKHHYQQVNWFLDRSALEIASHIEGFGFLALAIPASCYVNRKNQNAHLSHRHAAWAAGLGWKGRHGLVVTPQFGARVRFATILTDMPLIHGSPIEQDCGSCVACISKCPAEAISKEGCDVAKCYALLDKFAKIQGVGQHICGVCIRACKGKNG